MAQPVVPEIPFESVPNLLKLPPDLYLGEATGVAVNSKRHIFVFSRGNSAGPAYGAAAAQLLEFGPDGEYLREIGKRLYAWSFAHAVRIDQQDNIWAVDKGSDMIAKFDPEGRVAMVCGRKQEASDESTGPLKHPNPPLPAEDGRFRQPTDVAFDQVGNLKIPLISDEAVNIDEEGLVTHEFNELLHERPQSRLRHGWHQLVVQAALPEQGVDAPFGGAGFEMFVEAQSFASGAKQRQKRNRQCIEKP